MQLPALVSENAKRSLFLDEHKKTREYKLNVECHFLFTSTLITLLFVKSTFVTPFLMHKSTQFHLHYFPIFFFHLSKRVFIMVKNEQMFFFVPDLLCAH